MTQVNYFCLRLPTTAQLRQRAGFRFPWFPPRYRPYHHQPTAHTTLLLFRSFDLVDDFISRPFQFSCSPVALTPRLPDACTLISRDLLTREGGV
jgi:hypothetical protein